MTRAVLLLAALTVSTALAHAQPTLGVGGGVESLSAGYADGRALAAQLTLPRGGGWTRLDATLLDRFGERTVVVGAAAGHDIGERTVVTGALAGSTSGLIAPRVAASVAVGRRLTARRNVLATVGAGVRESRDGHLDLDALAEVAVYGERVVLQAGGRVSQSTPGSAWGGGGFVALTLVDGRGREVSARMAATQEAWAVFTPEARTDVSFLSAEATAAWREPVSGPWSATLGAGLYVNPYYTRVGLQTGVVRRF